MALWDTIPDTFIPQGISWRDKHEGLNPLRAEELYTRSVSESLSLFFY